MQQIREDLWETATETPMPGLTTHAYLLTREAGNLLFYNTSLQQEIERMGELGGVAYQFLSHRDELGDSLMQIRQRFGTRLGGHRPESSNAAAALGRRHVPPLQVSHGTRVAPLRVGAKRQLRAAPCSARESRGHRSARMTAHSAAS